MNCNFGKTVSKSLSILAASAGGAGFLPRMPGTWGTAVAIPIVVWGYETFKSPAAFRFFILTWLLLVCLISALVLPEVQKLWKETDPTRFVLDEVAGFLVVPLITGDKLHISVLLIPGFLLFRLFDISKPPGVRHFDRMKGTFCGVMGDDIVSGLYAGFILLILGKLI
ncbi:phosphatidylglycerophosphatase A family protein [Thermodesulforhabdus norvegica]|uniref:Phosphatidylglycerophosphatase A n=1 Tax=Thermodesulforhabdus norvegica TaxID=39841 RepID=A0A1I4RHA9_9BACT|nr:phosphatidylglycerophosphatase A [Thermodesulforhabdus norvegica]SFM51323.1 phosphatidylglycerophosphatase A [Thermodesulforhabdus norvegica]